MVCTSSGVFPHINDCSKYYRCIKVFALGLYKYDFTCPTKYFFDAKSGKCTKDQTVCKGKKFECSSVGVFADPLDSRTFYWCIKSLFGGFHQSTHKCHKREVFSPINKRCEKVIERDDDSDSETNESKEGSKSTKWPNTEEDRDSHSEKEDKNDNDEDNTKEEENDSREKNESKEVSEDKSKEKEKKKGFKCTEEGTFADPKKDNKYYICTYKNKEKNKFDKAHMKCEKRQVFDEDEGKCVEED
ncbi:hypothetical protein HA402_011535 [Bradysia odoriphaga]|nr:hypothetical protein HA402_011535 [Bradysia odoriphaga]